MRYPADWLDITHKVGINRLRLLHYDQELRPFYDIKRGEFYQLYHVRQGQQALYPNAFEYSGDWSIQDNCRSTEAAGASCAIKFKGAAISLEGLRGEDGGLAEIELDGESYGEIDQFGYTRASMPRYEQSTVPFRWSIDALSAGIHTLTLKVKRATNSASKGTMIRITGAKVYTQPKY